jgi:hypothetical protein
MRLRRSLVCGPGIGNRVKGLRRGLAVGGVGNVKGFESSYAWLSAYRADAVSQAGRQSLGLRFPEESVHLGRLRR